MMSSMWSSKRGKIIIIASIAILISCLVIGLLSFIIGSTFLALIVYLLLICALVRRIGLFIMYPGASFFTRSQIELQFSQDLSSKMVKCFNALHALSSCILEGRR
jgi:hypothetical protein